MLGTELQKQKGFNIIVNYQYDHKLLDSMSFKYSANSELLWCYDLNIPNTEIVPDRSLIPLALKQHLLCKRYQHSAFSQSYQPSFIHTRLLIPKACDFTFQVFFDATAISISLTA